MALSIFGLLAIATLLAMTAVIGMFKLITGAFKMIIYLPLLIVLFIVVGQGVGPGFIQAPLLSSFLGGIASLLTIKFVG